MSSARSASPTVRRCILLTARFLLAGILILGISALRGEALSLSWRDAAVFAILGSPTTHSIWGLATPVCRCVAGLGGLVVSANGLHRGAGRRVSGEALTWRKVAGLLLGVAGVGFIVWHRLSVGTDDWHGILFTLASLASIVLGTILFKVFDQRAACGSAMA